MTAATILCYGGVALGALILGLIIGWWLRGPVRPDYGYDE